MSQPEFTRTQEVSIQPTPEEVARAFWGMDADQQVRFFNELSEISKDRFIFQLSAVTMSPYFTPAARRIMQIIGEYGE